MDSINNTRKVLYGKEEDEPLTPDEQAGYDDVMAWIQPANVVADPTDPAVREALKVYSYIIKEHTTTWEQAKRVIFPGT